MKEKNRLKTLVRPQEYRQCTWCLTMNVNKPMFLSEDIEVNY